MLAAGGTGLVAVMGLAGLASAATSSGCGLSGAFRDYSERIFYDQGGSGGMGDPTRELVFAGSRWQYGPSSGSFRVTRISAADWKGWRVSPYGPTSKMVLSGWDGGGGSGPIEGTDVGVDFFWVIYRVAPPLVSAPGLIEMKFGHAVIPRSCGATAPVGAARLTVAPAVIKAGGSVRLTASKFPPKARTLPLKPVA